MTAFLGMGRSFSFVPVGPQGPQEPGEAEEHEHHLAKVSERHVHGHPPFRRAGGVYRHKRIFLVGGTLRLEAEGGPPTVYGRLPRGGPRKGIVAGILTGFN